MKIYVLKTKKLAHFSLCFKLWYPKMKIYVLKIKKFGTFLKFRSLKAFWSATP